MAMSCGVMIIFIALTWIFLYNYLYPELVCNILYGLPCGIIFNESSGEGCVNPSFEVICENNKSVIYFNYGESQTHAILASNSSSFRYIETGFSPDNNCPIINFLSLPNEKVSFFPDPYHQGYMVVMRCEEPIDYDRYWDISPQRCGGSGIDGAEKQRYYIYNVEDSYYQDFDVRYIAESCRVETKVMISRWDVKVKCNSKCGYPEVHSEYVNGIELRWRPIRCEQQQKDGDRESRREWGRARLPLRCIYLDAAYNCLQIGRICKSIILYFTLLLLFFILIFQNETGSKPKRNTTQEVIFAQNLTTILNEYK